MTSLSKLKKIKTGVALALLIIIFIILNVGGFPEKFRNFFYFISAPVQKSFWGMKWGINEENEKLKLKNQELLSGLIEFEKLKKENEVLREALGIGLEKEFKLIFTQIIEKDPVKDFILINKGSEDNILGGYPVITQQKVLVGKISQVYKNFSKVMLISNKESVFDAKIQNEETFGVIKGKENLGIFFDLIPLEAKIKEKDILVTSDLESVYPKGLLIGEIEKIKKSGAEPFQRAEIKPFFDIIRTDSLFIIFK